MRTTSTSSTILSVRIAPDSGKPGQLRPACTSAHASAAPGRRLIETARAFAENGNVLSICSDDWSGLMIPLQELMRPAELGATCFPRAQVRDANGRVDCKLYWDLPPPERAPEGTPTHCSQRRFLKPAHGARVLREASARMRRCDRQQKRLTAVDPDDGGWYYDDFSTDRRRQCIGSDRARVAFTPYSAPRPASPCRSNASRRRCCRTQATPPAPMPLHAACPTSSARREARRRTMNGVGDRCTPTNVPATGFDNQRVYLETGSAQCASGVCMVYHLHGNPRPECMPCLSFNNPSCDPSLRCAEGEVANRVYCSCRCDAGPDAPGCECPARLLLP